jgi:hypothetical protein
VTKSLKGKMINDLTSRPTHVVMDISKLSALSILGALCCRGRGTNANFPCHFHT